MRYIDAFNHFFPKRIYELMLRSAAGQKEWASACAAFPRCTMSTSGYASSILPRLHPGALARHAADRPALRARQVGGMGADRQRRPRRAGRQISRPLRRLLRLAADERAGGRGKEAERVLTNGANAIQLHTNVDGGPIDQEAVLADLRGRSRNPASRSCCTRSARGEMPTTAPRRFEVRNLQRARLALRDRRRAGATRVLRDDGPLPESEGDRAPPRRHDSLFRRPRRPQLGSVGRAHVGRGLFAPAEEPEEAALRLLQGLLRRHRGRGRARSDDLRIVFFGPDHVLFASDCPFDKEKGPGYIRSTIKVLNSIGLAEADKEKICFRNAQRCLGCGRLDRCCATSRARLAALVFRELFAGTRSGTKH